GISVLGRGIVRMHEISKGAIGDTCEEGASALPLQLVPTHVRHFQTRRRGRKDIRETPDLSLKNAESRSQPKLLTLRQQRLHTHTSARPRPPRLHHLTQRLIQATRQQILHAVTKGAHARKDNRVGTSDDVRITADLHLSTNLREPILHAPEVPSAVID